MGFGSMQNFVLLVTMDQQHGCLNLVIVLILIRCCEVDMLTG